MNPLKCLLAVAIVAGSTASVSAQPAAQPRPATRCVVIEAFVRDGSPASDAARKYLDQLSAKRSGLHLVYRNLDQSEPAAKRLDEIGRFFKIDKPATPTIYLCRKVVSGFEDEMTGREIDDLLTVEVFVREGCPRCARGKAFLATLQPQYPGLRFVYRDIIQDAQGRARWESLSRQHNVLTPGIPTVHAFGHLSVGFDGPESTGAKIESMLRSVTTPCLAEAAPPRKPAAGHRDTESGTHPRRAEARGRTSGARRSSPATAAAPGRPAAAPANAPPPPLADGEPPSPMPGEAPAPSPDETPSPGDRPSANESEHRIHNGSTVNGSVTLPLIGQVNVRDVGLPVFTLAVGLVDGFNPCAMWVLVFLLSVLVNLHSRWKMLAVAGTFVFVSGLAYFTFMAAWMNVFLLIGCLRWIQIGLGLFGVFAGVVNVKDYFAFKEGVSLSIPDSVKPTIYERVRRIVSAPNLTAAIAGAIVLAVLVNVVELLCTAGLPAMYTNILAAQGFPWWKNYLYLALYEVTYMLDDTLLLGAVVITLSRRKLQEKEGRWLKLLSGVIVLGLGLVMLFKPEWLA